MNYNVRQRDEGKEIGASLIVFLIWPFLGTIIGLASIKSKSAKCFLLASFLTVMGLNTLYQGVTGDAVRYAEYFRDICYSGLDINGIFDQGRIDILPFVSMKLVSFISSSPSVLFAFWGAIWGVFAFLTCYTAASIAPLKRNVMWVFMLVLFWTDSPTFMQTYRFFVSIWIFAYFFIKSEITRNKKWMLYMLITPFVHTAFLLPVMIYIAYRFLAENRLSIKILTIVFVICFLFATYGNVTQNVSSYGYLLEDTRYVKYLSDREIQVFEMLQEQSNAKVQLANNLAHYGGFVVVMLMQYLIVYKKKSNVLKPFTLNLDRFLLLFASFSYLVSSIPSMSRYKVLSNIVLVVLAFHLMSQNIIKRRWMMLSLIVLSYIGTFYLGFAKMPERYDVNFLLPIVYLTPIF